MYKSHKYSRRKFIRQAAFVVSGFTLSANTVLSAAIEKSYKFYNSAFEKLLDLLNTLKLEGSNIVKKVMNGKVYVFDPYVNYPYDGGIKDKDTGCRIFFHCHRKGEYGHFHTFYQNEKGELAHLVLISMAKDGEPLKLATVNSWVTGDKYYKSDVLKTYFEKFSMNNYSFGEKRIAEFVKYVFAAYKTEIFQLFEERDAWVKDYALKYFREPFEDRDFEITSEIEIDVHRDSRKS